MGPGDGRSPGGETIVCMAIAIAVVVVVAVVAVVTVVVVVVVVVTLVTLVTLVVNIPLISIIVIITVVAAVTVVVTGVVVVVIVVVVVVVVVWFSQNMHTSSLGLTVAWIPGIVESMIHAFECVATVVVAGFTKVMSVLF